MIKELESKETPMSFLDIQETMLQNAISIFDKKIEEKFIEGLKNKGYEFKNRFELENFVKSNCRCTIDFTQKRVYYVNNVPFLELHLDFKNNIFNNNINFDFGSFKFL